MRATKHAAQQPWRRRGLFKGIPSGLRGIGAGRAADASAAGTRAAAPSDAGSEAGGGAGATVQPTASASPTILASATPSPPVSATPAGSATSTPPASSRAAARAGRIKPAVTHQGVATAYAAGDGSGSCLTADGTGCGGALRITGIYREPQTVDGIAVQPDVAQPTRVQCARH